MKTNWYYKKKWAAFFAYVFPCDLKKSQESHTCMPLIPKDQLMSVQKHLEICRRKAVSFIFGNLMVVEILGFLDNAFFYFQFYSYMKIQLFKIKEKIVHILCIFIIYSIIFPFFIMIYFLLKNRIRVFKQVELFQLKSDCRAYKRATEIKQSSISLDQILQPFIVYHVF